MLPSSRNTTYSALSQVKSADLNDIQDWIIDHETRIETGLHGYTYYPVEPFDAAHVAGGSPAFTGGTSSQYWTLPTTGDGIVIRLPLTTGETLQSVLVRAKSNGADAMAVISIYPVVDGVVGSALSLTGSGSTSGTTVQTATATLTTPYTLSEGDAMIAEISNITSGSPDFVELYSALIEKARLS